MIEALSEHCDLNDAVEAVIPERLKDHFPILLGHLAVYFGSPEAALFVDRANLARVIDATGGGDNLVRESRLFAHHQTPTNARFDYVTIALRRERDPAPKPRFLA